MKYTYPFVLEKDIDMHPSKAPAKLEQVMYNGRFVDKAHFRAFVYNETGQKLANSYDEYEELITSGVWFSEKNKVISAPPEEQPEDDGND